MKEKNYLTMKKALALSFFLLLSLATFAQGIKVEGVVKENSGETAIGVAVRVKGTQLGTVTDANGKYSVTVNNTNAILVYSYLGFKTQEVNIDGRNVVDVTLQEDLQLLQEVVVVGYGTMKKENLTGAVSQIDSKAFENRPTTSIATAMQGSIAGVNIAPPTGSPNEDISFNIRGTTSINGGEPLVLVDGVEMNMKLVNPSDIESVTVLKDAAASAIYGVRAAFGVILVTTKKGVTDRLTINYSGNFSWAKPTILPEFVDNSVDHAEFINLAMKNYNGTTMYDAKQMEAIRAYHNDPINNKPYYITDAGDYVPAGYTDWYGMTIRDYNPKQTHNVSISGGSGKTRFYTSYGHTKQEGIFKVNPDVFKRNNARLTVENQTYNWMKIGFKALFNASRMDEPTNYKDNAFHQIVFGSPLRPNMWLGDPNYPQYDEFAGMYFDDQNPLSLLDKGGRTIKKEQEIVLSPNLLFTPIKNWNINVDFTYIKSSSEDKEHKKPVEMLSKSFAKVLGSTSDNSLKITTRDKEYYSFNAFTDYEMTLKEKHYLKGMLGFNQELTKYGWNSAMRKGLLSETTPSLALGQGEHEVAQDGWENALRGGFGRINYIYDNKYLFEVNGRYDGTSRFPSDNRFTFLPSFSLAWRASEESFMKFSRTIFDDIKFRVSYGKLGNQFLNSTAWTGNTKYYPYIPFLTQGTNQYYVLNGSVTQLAINPAGLTSGALTWEKSATINGGLDLTLLSSRLNMTLDVYQRTTSDMLIAQQLPEVLGATVPHENKGELQTRGWELTVSWKDKIGKDFSYEISANISDANSKISKWEGARGTVDGYYKGKKLGEIWGFKSNGFYQTQEQADAAPKPNWGSNWGVGDINFLDLDGSGRVDKGQNNIDDHGDLRVIGNTTPRYSYGFNLSASFKGIFMSAFFQGIGKRDFWPDNQAYWPAATQYFNTQKWFITDSWSEDNRNAYFPKPSARETKNTRAQKQDRYIEDASYLRMKNLTVGYEIPSQWTNKVKLSRAQIYFSGENIFEHSNMKGPYDPEASQKSAAMIYPFQRSYSIGIDLTF